MIFRMITVCLFVAAVLAIPQPASAVGTTTIARALNATARARSAYRQSIQRLPIQLRPDRPGHFYGNTVRRIYRRRAHGG